MVYSVIIPARNEIPHLWYTLHAIRQIWEHSKGEAGEIIVVDDGSDDETQQFLQDPVIQRFVRSIRLEGTSVATARQAGAEAARGDVLFFMDAHILPAHDFFNRAIHTIRKRVWETLGFLHFAQCWNWEVHGRESTHYRLTLERDFWGTHTVGRFPDLTEIAAGCHACSACRRDRFLEIGACRSPFHAYGGSELYLDLKMRMWGYRNYTDPNLYFLHCKTRQMRYPWNHDTLSQNQLMAAYVLGGRAYSDQVYESKKAEHKQHDRLALVYAEALKAGEPERQLVAQQARLSLDEVLADLATRGVPR